MNPMSIMAQAEKLGIPELQRSIQSGTVPAFIGVPLLQEKVKKAKQMQMGMAAQQPKRPSVAEQVGQEAQQATIADIMKAQALRMQGEMGQTGGISDSLPKPEGYDKGGIIAFASKGLVPGFTYQQALDILDEPAATPDEKIEAHRIVANQSAMQLGVPQGSNQSQKPTITPLVPTSQSVYTPSLKEQVPEPSMSFDFANPNQVVTDVLANPARANTDPDLWKWATDYRAQNPVKTPYAKVEQQPVMQSAVNQPVTDLSPAQSQGLTALYNEAITQNPIVTAEQARQNRENYLGTNTGIASLREDVNKMKSEAESDKERAPWMALMKAGLATMAGTSPYALTNIGKGAKEGVADYMAAQKDYRQAQEKQLELNAKFDMAERQEKMDAFKYGEDSEKASRSANTALKIGQLKDFNKDKLDQAELGLKQAQVGISQQNAQTQKELANKPNEVSLIMDLAAKIKAQNPELSDAEAMQKAMISGKINAAESPLRQKELDAKIANLKQDALKAWPDSTEYKAAKRQARLEGLDEKTALEKARNNYVNSILPDWARSDYEVENKFGGANQTNDIQSRATEIARERGLIK
jgi:hypothetical protein